MLGHSKKITGYHIFGVTSGQSPNAGACDSFGDCMAVSGCAIQLGNYFKIRSNNHQMLDGRFTLTLLSNKDLSDYISFLFVIISYTGVAVNQG